MSYSVSHYYRTNLLCEKIFCCNTLVSKTRNPFNPNYFLPKLKSVTLPKLSEKGEVEGLR